MRKFVRMRRFIRTHKESVFAIFVLTVGTVGLLALHARTLEQWRMCNVWYRISEVVYSKIQTPEELYHCYTNVEETLFPKAPPPEILKAFQSAIDADKAKL